MSWPGSGDTSPSASPRCEHLEALTRTLLEGSESHIDRTRERARAYERGDRKEAGRIFAQIEQLSAAAAAERRELATLTRKRELLEAGLRVRLEPSERASLRS